MRLPTYQSWLAVDTALEGVRVEVTQLASRRLKRRYVVEGQANQRVQSAVA